MDSPASLLSLPLALPVTVALLGAAAPLLAQPASLSSRLTLYGDNTEFFTPYRRGETILGGHFTSRLVVEPSSRFGLHLGVFGDVRWGSTDFLDRVKPILSLRYHTETSLGVIGTLETDRRHGLLDPLAVSTLEFTRPIEYGVQWRERRRRWDAEVFLNWQVVGTTRQAEVFDYGVVLRLKPVRRLGLVYQRHDLHRGGQLAEDGEPVASNSGSAAGVEVAEPLGGIGTASAALYRLWSRGQLGPARPTGRPERGAGTFLKVGLAPKPGFEVFAVQWWGRDFLAEEGDRNYGSIGRRETSYRSRRTYFELGMLRRARFDGGVEVDAEFRFHRFDGGVRSPALFDSSWEYSYRLVARAPIEVRLR
ncbi:MAG: hypothetical protein FJ206_12490 [Gemmatimonadetes bacterium]|nr:hypothetical protein [Gemmatimonadota bacterium]